MSLSIHAPSKAAHRLLFLCLATTAGASMLLPAATAADALGRARAARVLSVNDAAHMHLISSGGNTLIEEGQATGSLPGRVRAHLSIGPSTVKSSFTIYLHGGSISGRGVARLNVGHGAYASFGGSLTVTHGSGRYAHVYGSGGLYGTINRNNDNAVVQVVGNLHV
jgi:hypothetical protein